MARGIPVIQQGDLGEAAFVHKAMSLGFVVAKPYGNNHRYDFIVRGGGKWLRVQVKTCASTLHGLYNVCTRCSTHSRLLAYKESELDFVAAYIMPEGTWFILPAHEVAGHSSILLRPMRPEGPRRRDPFVQYREAWHLLGDPGGPAISVYPSKVPCQRTDADDGVGSKANGRNLFDELADDMTAMKAHRAGKLTLRSYKVEARALPDVKPEMIKQVRARFHCSRSVFARKLFTNERTLEKWEQGRAKPNAQAAALLLLAARYPDTFERLEHLAE